MLGSDQIETLADHCPTIGPLVRIAAYTGIRRGELLRLRKEQTENGLISLGTDTKTGKPRAIPVPDRARAALDALEWPLPENLDQTIRREFEAAREACSLPHIRWHDLRHSYASLLAQAGVKQCMHRRETKCQPTSPSGETISRKIKRLKLSASRYLGLLQESLNEVFSPGKSFQLLQATWQARHAIHLVVSLRIALAMVLLL